MKAVVVPLVVVLGVQAWPCAAKDHFCSAADTVVSAGEQKTVASITRRYSTVWSTPIYLHPESAFEGVQVSTTTSSGTYVLWFPAHTHCFTHNADWWRVLVFFFYSYTGQDCVMEGGACTWHCLDTELPGKPLSSQVVAVGASRWRAAKPPGNCTVINKEFVLTHTYESCSPTSKHPTTDSNPTTTTTTTTDSPSTITTTTTDSSSTTTTTDCPTTTTTNNLSSMVLVMVVVVVTVVVVMVAMAVMVRKIRHNRPRAPDLSSSSSSSLGFLYKKNFDNVAEYC